MCKNTTATLKRRLPKASCTAAKKSVRFAGAVEVALKKSSSQEELNSAWYAPLEYKSFQIDSRRSLKAVTSNLCGDANAYDASEHCLRGLESCLSPQLYQSRKEHKRNIVEQVLKEQLLHRLVGIQDPERLAFRSRAISHQAQERALLLAVVDCREHIQHQQEGLKVC